VSASIELLKGDIAQLKVDAIVNAANKSLLGGGGVDGAIHRAAGPELMKECRSLGGCETGHAKITNGYRLPATWVIHTVGPVWANGENNEDELLASCYRSVLALASKCFIRTLAFPSISTGAFRFPLERAARIALREIRLYLSHDDVLQKIYIVCFNDEVKDAYERLLKGEPPL
jgi:O-acetyl-ADP-ribose deacetylase